MTEKLKEIISRYINVNPDTITIESDLRGDLGMTSLELVDMAVAIEDEYGIQLDDLAMVNTKTVADILALLQK